MQATSAAGVALSDATISSLKVSAVGRARGILQRDGSFVIPQNEFRLQFNFLVEDEQASILLTPNADVAGHVDSSRGDITFDPIIFSTQISGEMFSVSLSFSAAAIVQPPQAVIAPGPVVRECEQGGTVAQLDASQSFDPDDDLTGGVWGFLLPDGTRQTDGSGSLSTSFNFPLGVSAAQLVVYDRRGALGSDTVTVEVVDTVAPVLEVSDQVVELCEAGASAVITPPSVTEACSPDELELEGLVVERNGIPLLPPIELSSGSAQLEPGNYIVEWIATDPGGNVSSARHRVKVLGLPVIYTTESLRLGDRSVVAAGQGWGNISNAGQSQTDIGVEAKVGTVQSVGNIRARDRSEVHGHVQTGGTFNEENDVLVVGSIHDGISITLHDQPQLTTAVFTGGHSMDLGPDEEIILTPGSYGRVSVKSRATLVLQSGNYNFSAFLIEPQATVLLDSPLEYNVRVESELIFRGAFEGPGTTTRDQLRIEYFGHQRLQLEAPLDATVVAPFAQLVIGP